MYKKNKAPLDVFLEGIEASSKQPLPKDIEQKVIDFIKKNPDPDDTKVHDFSETLGVDTHELEAVFYRLASKYVESLS